MIMKGQNVGSVPVISDRNSGHVIGIITDRDIALRVVAEQREYYHTHVGDVMSKDVVTCKMDDDYDEVIAAMKENQIHRIPVVDSTKRLVGIIALADVAREAKPKTVGETVEEISQRSGERERESSANYTKTSLMVAGGIGLGAGLIYLLDPRWARRARETVANAAGKEDST
jgi:signal-transduction protein with cAMP-binding, CBS, and nucleotidyltransferase domain